jgi:hypothetical protein
MDQISIEDYSPTAMHSKFGKQATRMNLRELSALTLCKNISNEFIAQEIFRTYKANFGKLNQQPVLTPS